MPKDIKPSDATEVLNRLVGSGFIPESLDQVHDTFRLLGAVIGQLALLKVVTDPTADNKDIVSAAKTLASLKEDPAKIAERLRTSILADLSVGQLRGIIQRVEAGDASTLDLASLIQEVKGKK